MAEPQLLTAEDNAATAVLPDGRLIAYAQYGAEAGPTVICLHGAPGSRIDFKRSDAAAKVVGARLIAVDRPGIGLSSPDPNGTLLTFAKDVEALTEILNLDSYAVLGGSAGGPYSLACAYSLPAGKLKALAIICGIGGTHLIYDDMEWLRWAGYKCAYWLPAAFFRWFWSRDPGSQVHLSTEEHLNLFRSTLAQQKVAENDPCQSEESLQLWLETSREVFKHGLDGIVADTYRLLSDWGFRLEDIRKDLPIQLWYGTSDGLAPPGLGRLFAQKLGPNARLVLKNETHGSMFANQPQAYLQELIHSWDYHVQPRN